MKIIRELLRYLIKVLKDETGSMNFGVGRNGLSPSVSMQAYHYDDLIYRKYITRIALDFYTGRQDSYVWLDLQKQFRKEIAA